MAVSSRSGPFRRLRAVDGPESESLRTEQDVQDAYDRYGGELFAFALNALRDRQLAEDVVQETFVRAWRSAARFDPNRGSLRTWLFAITRNGLVDVTRRRAVQAPVAVDARMSDDGSAAIEDPVDRLLSSIQLDEALRRLSPEHRQAVVEVHYHGRTCAELAAGLNLPASTVRSRLYYGVRALRLVLEENGWLA